MQQINNNIEILTLKQQYEYTLTEAKRTTIGNLLLVAIFIYLQYSIEFPQAYTILWAISFAFITAYRVSLITFILPKVKNNLPTLDYFKLTRHSNLSLMLLGALWGSIFFALMHYQHQNNVSSALILATALGFSGASMFSAGASFKTFSYLNLPIVIAIIAGCYLYRHNPQFMVPAMIATLAYTFIFSSAFRFSQKFVTNIQNDFRLRQAKQEVIEVLGRAGDYRDEETGEHINRMSHSCYQLARAFGFSDDEAVKIRHASTLHDIGKIGIPDDILLKPGKLTPAEQQIMQQHSRIGYEILGGAEKSETLKLAKTICLYHHERWDGTGYPTGIKGKEIPIEARIATICDVFDALTSDRPYKQAWPEKEAVQFIKDHSGIYFDPELVPIFMQTLPVITAFNDNNREH